MARTNALTGSHIAAFKGIEIHENLQVIVDSRGPRVVVHEFPFKDAAKIEAMGRKPHHTEWTITFTGDTWMSDFLQLSDSIDAAPAGLLVHPIWGQMQVVCQGFDRSTVNVVEATNTITLQLAFVEDVQDLGLDQQATVASVAQDTSASIASFQDTSSPYTSASATATALSYASMASNFTIASSSAAQNQTADPSLSAQLTLIGEQLGLVEAAMQADPLASQSVAGVYDVLAAAELVFSQCLVLSQQLQLQTVQYKRVTTGGRTTIVTVAQAEFGSDAINYIDQILQLNPQLTDPSNIPPNTTIVLPLSTGAP